MANHSSAEKRHRQTIKRTARNQALRTRVRSSVKKFRTAIESSDAQGAARELREVTRVLDQAVSKGVLHRNNASRRVSRLAKRAARQGAAASGASAGS